MAVELFDPIDLYYILTGEDWDGGGDMPSLNPPTPLAFGIMYANHPVNKGFDHSKLIITPHNQAYWRSHPLFKKTDANRNHYLTIGAGPDSLLNIAGPMVAGFNRDNDIKLPRNNRMILNVPTRYGGNEDLAIAALLALVENYNNNKVEYTLIPRLAGEYNSNSFIAGLLSAAGFNSVPSPGGLPYGFDNPVPYNKFIPSP
jgi:hypothetical protein